MILRISSTVPVALLAFALLLNACGTDSSYNKASNYKDTLVLTSDNILPENGLEGIGDSVVLPPVQTIGPASRGHADTVTGVTLPPNSGQLLADSLKTNRQVSKMLEDYTQPGRLLWQIPEEMAVAKETLVVVRITRGTTTGQLTLGIDTSNAPVSIQTIATTSEMRVYLNGDPTAFRITPLGLNGQNYVSDRTFTEWRWAVTPLKPGTFYLSLDVVAQVYIDGKAMPPMSKIVYSNKFKVKATITYWLKSILTFCKDYWVILAAAATGISTLIWKRQSGRRRRRNTTHDS